MSIEIERPKELMATEIRGEMDDGETRPLLMGTYTSDWSDFREVVVKLQNPGVNGQKEAGTHLACELICSVLARVLGFDVPDYALVEISEDFIESVADKTLQARLKENVGWHFGTSYLKGVNQWRCQKRLLGSGVKRILVDLLEYDGAIVNGDRTEDNSNLLWDGTRLYLIDHGLALSVFKKSVSEYQTFLNRPLMQDEEIKKHSCFQHLLWQELPFGGVAERWNKLPMDEILTMIEGVLPDSWESHPGDFERIFGFLSVRAGHFEAITDQLRRVVL